MNLGRNVDMPASFMLFFMACFHSSMQQVITEGQSKEQDHLCNKDLFFQFFVIKDKNFEISGMKKCSLNDRCHLQNIQYRLAEHGGDYYFVIQASNLTVQNGSECWGYYLKIISRNGTKFEHKYLNFDTQKKETEYHTNFKSQPTEFTVSITSIPSGRTKKIFINGINKCEGKIVSRIETVLEKSKDTFGNCSTLSLYPQKFRVAREVCQLNPTNFSRQYQDVDNIIMSLNRTCDLYQALSQLHVQHKYNESAGFVCSKIWFMKKYVNQGKPYSVTKLQYDYIRSICQRTCDEAILTVSYTSDNNSRYAYMIGATGLTHERNRECWGYLLTIEDLDGKKSKITYINFDKEQKEIFLMPLPLRNYHIKLLSIPAMKEPGVQLPYLDQCERIIMANTLTWSRKLRCNKGITVPIFGSLLKTFIAPICKKYLKNTEEAKKEVNRYLENNKKPCSFIYEPGWDEKTTITTTTLALVSTTVAIFILIIFILVIRYIRNQRRRRITSNEDSARDNLVTLQDFNIDTDIPSVMILSRPGCELLESLLRDLACILTSYCVKVKLALLDQNEVDAEGGISSYMQRNLDSCDYILIMFTENTQEKALPKHKPYEFALRVISGLAYHNNSCSRYIPMYLTSYNEAVHLLPSFLNASTSFGYRIPKDTYKLICRIFNLERLTQTNERQAKDNYFIDRMKSTAKLIVDSHHETCCSINCTKGQLYDSVSNLSSIWASTANSKYGCSPRHTIDENTPSFNISNNNEILNNNGVVNSMIQTFNNISHSNISVTQIVNKHINYPMKTHLPCKRSYSSED
ncbi:uncharacterized protein LOC130654349 isoform X3 [Hydractinia symbiolongicarpus]|uniref:uncharacterized protein LOC130654349 isoform X3 n=1 Tax=Hydractinia symbiolongicarpus TaxID=13093 RepID=UPI00254F9468|nr:uncharacterized protein LOC130654349 isoform X3 [Hydractinia symbiolongicarpus]